MATTGPPTSSIAFSVADFGIHALVDMVLNSLDHDDGVVDHQANGKHKSEQRKRVDGKSERGKDDERADERNRNRQQRNESGAPALKKDEDDDDDKAERFKQREHDFANAGRHGLRGVERDAVRDARREGGGELLDALVYRGRSLYGIGSGQLIDRHHACRRLVVAAGNSIGLVAKLDARNVAQVKNRAIGIGAKNDVAELLWLDQPALRANRVGELLPLRDRLSANLAGRIDVVLRLDRGDHVGRRNAKLREFVGLHPDAQRILPAECLHARNALHASDLILKIDDGVIGEKILAQFAARRIDGDEHQRRGKRLLHREAGGRHLRGKLRLRLVDAKLREHLVNVWIGLDIEVHKQLDHAVVRADGVHVDHVVDAIHLLLDRRRHSLADGLGVGARVSRGNKDFGRNDVGILRDRQREHRHDANHHGEDGDDNRDDRPADEEFRHELPPAGCVCSEVPAICSLEVAD